PAPWPCPQKTSSRRCAAKRRPMTKTTRIAPPSSTAVIRVASRGTSARPAAPSLACDLLAPRCERCATSRQRSSTSHVRRRRSCATLTQFFDAPLTTPCTRAHFERSTVDESRLDRLQDDRGSSLHRVAAAARPLSVIGARIFFRGRY